MAKIGEVPSDLGIKKKGERSDREKESEQARKSKVRVGHREKPSGTKGEERAVAGEKGEEEKRDGNNAK